MGSAGMNLLFKITFATQNHCRMSVAKKLRMKEDAPLYLLKAPAYVAVLFDGFDVKTSPKAGREIKQALVFAENKKALDSLTLKVAPLLEDDALLWIAYPKKTGKIKSDMSRDNGWETVMAAGYEPVTQVAIDDDWSALRFRKSEAIGPKLRDIPMEARQMEGVDFVNRTVTLPKDIEKALKTDKELLAFFNKLSFSHKKEYVEYVVEAKKQETREQRIPKMIATLAEYKAEKEKKK